jgi:phosphate transport system protein
MNILMWLLNNYWMNNEEILMMDIDRELKRLNEDLLKSCRLTQDVIKKTSNALIRYDIQKIKEIIDDNKKIGVLCVDSEEHLSNVIKQYQPEGSVLAFISAGINVNIELKQIADLTAGIAESLLSFNTDISDRYKINISQFAIFFQNIVWDSVLSFLKQDAELSKKTVLTSLALKKICNRIQNDLIAANKIVESNAKERAILLFIIQNVRDIADHAVNIAKI